jgi:ribonuclease E
MLIDATHPEETRVVVLRGNRVEEFDFETAHRKQLRGNIYLAKVTRVEPSLQAAFVDYGGNRHGFLAFSEIHPDYYQIPVADRQALLAEERHAHDDEDDDENRSRRRHGRHRRERQHQRRDETLTGDAPVADGAAHEAGESPAGDAGEQPQEAHGDHPHAEPAAEVQTASETPPFEAAPPAPEPGAVGETANPPVEAEAAAPNPVAETDQPPHERSDAGDLPIEAAPASGDAAPANGDGEHPGHDEEEEVVESVGGADAMEEVPVRPPRFRRQYKIQEVIKRRQVMLVQVVKEERGTKGAALTTYLSLAGRYCVLMPNTARGGGISRKITSAEDRKKLREIAEELEVPDGMGVILRTAGAARTKPEVKRDFEYLLRMWEQVRDLTLKSTAPTLVYEEGSLAKRSIRDLYTKEFDDIIVAGETGYRDAKEFMRMLMPSHARNVKLYQDSQPIFSRYGIESQLDAMFSPTVQLKSGGYIVINQAEALVAIDVNSGRSTREHHIEDTALKTNVEAAEEVARQLRLRDLAGLIVIDFIDMDEKRNNRTVERRLKDALRNDRARIQVGRISHFGLMEMSRQRIRTSVLESSTEKCPHCGGTGHVRSVSSVALQLLRGVEEALQKGATHNLTVRTRPEIALYVLNQKRAHLRALEERYRITITINSDPELGGGVGFAVDRGEQVMTAEQAKALAQQYEANPPQLLVEDEPDVPHQDAAETEVAAEAPDAGYESGEPAAFASGDAPQPRHDGDHGEPRDGGPRRRRRRRGRGGRGGEPREHSQFPQQSREPQAEHAIGDPNLVHAGSFDQPAPGAEPGDAYAPPQHYGEPRHDQQGNGEHRRRRRGRRGGRRNRHDRDDNRPSFGGYDERPQDNLGGNGRPTYEPQPAPVASESRPDIMQDAPPAPQAAAPAPAEPPPAAAPRRRSTVREAAPVFGAGSEPAMPAPPPASSPPPVTEPTSTDDAAKPRRTGWWAKRLLGGDKS